MEIEHKVASVGQQLAIANVSWCADTMIQPGYMISDTALYRSHAARTRVSALYGVPRTYDGAFVVAAVHNNDGSLPLPVGALVPVAARATPIDPLSPAHARIDAFWETMRAPNAAADPRPRGCAAVWRVEASDKMFARSDGRVVAISSRLADYALRVGGEAGLAAVLAHEMAHNVLRHRALRKADRARSADAVRRQTEEQADRLSIWFVTRADMIPGRVFAFWERYAKDHGNRLGLFDNRHNSWAKRIAVMRTEADEVIASFAADAKVWPPFVPRFSSPAPTQQDLKP